MTGKYGTSVPDARCTADPTLHRIVIVGGGAGGLELATRLGETLGKRGRASITLVDRNRTHIWKPLLHQVAASRLDMDDDELEYLAQARWHHFRFFNGAMDGLDREQRRIFVAPTVDEDGQEITPRRAVPYDTLVIAVGSTANDFGTPGVAEHAIALDSAEQAVRFNRKLINACLRANSQHEPLRPGQLHVAIIGAGATGVELAAELHKTTREIAAFGLDSVDFDQTAKLTLIEAGPRIVPQLPEPLSEGVADLLKGLGVDVLTGRKVTTITPEGVALEDGTFIASELKVWAAGVKAPAFLAELGLETNRINQILVRDTLQSTVDDNIFAFGDCAACALPNGSFVPPRAQAAHQQASLLLKAMKARLKGEALPRFHYKDFGSLVSLGKYSAVGSLMGGLIGGNVKIQGLFAKVMYKSLYKMHLIALHGWFKMLLDTVGRAVLRRTEPHVKLH
ncbi:NAD(P)/FAD-dependent oxidoreductase [Nitrogeniibacter mangrovi]|uniref:NAD(P)/FAD-dependent oxidoreductase n=1 Tax=Nitrogeniibacter mangrovi TaxID=2016596 RepID=A0A6C1B707_9RHOO|nr:NAD(P)/FAD-dependent oxidoreductase [Nitrogeniibacter mangrovi]QID18605.1 NAD(P)/FAD-dependent oxidoreductase [Nitrogeniibacter mangrovi]